MNMNVNVATLLKSICSVVVMPTIIYILDFFRRKKEARKKNIEKVQDHIEKLKLAFNILNRNYNGPLQNYDINERIPLNTITSAKQLHFKVEADKKKLSNESISDIYLHEQSNSLKNSVEKLDDLITNYFKIDSFIPSYRDKLTDLKKYLEINSPDSLGYTNINHFLNEISNCIKEYGNKSCWK